MISKRAFSTFPEPLSVICMGTARFGGDYDDQKSMELLDAYYAMGGRFLDTANVYGRWSARGGNESERVIGEWLRIRQITDMTVTSKCCHYAPDAKEVPRLNREAAWHDLDESRRSLGLDVIPIYLTHRDDPSVDVRRIVDFMADMVTAGRVTRFGFSNYPEDRIRTAIEYMGKDWRSMLVGVSNEWSLHEEWQAAEHGGHIDAPDGMAATDVQLWNLHRELNLPLIPFSAAAHGFYDKTDPETMSDAERQVYERLTEESANRGMSRTAVSLAYIQNSGVPAIPIAAVSSVGQLAEFEAIAAVQEDLSYLSPFAEMN